MDGLEEPPLTLLLFNCFVPGQNTGHAGVRLSSLSRFYMEPRRIWTSSSGVVSSNGFLDCGHVRHSFVVPLRAALGNSVPLGCMLRAGNKLVTKLNSGTPNWPLKDLPWLNLVSAFLIRMVFQPFFTPFGLVGEGADSSIAFIPLGMKLGSSSPYATLSRAILSSLLSRTFTKVTVMQSVRPRPSVQLFDPLSWDPSLVMLGFGTMAITSLHVVLVVILWVPFTTSCTNVGCSPMDPPLQSRFGWIRKDGRPCHPTSRTSTLPPSQLHTLYSTRLGRWSEHITLFLGGLVWFSRFLRSCLGCVKDLKPDMLQVV